MTRRATTTRDPISSDFLERLAEMRRRKDGESPPEAPTAQVAPTKREPEPLPEVAPTRQVAPTAQVAGYTLLTHEVTDSILRTLDPYSQAVLVQLLRLSWGFQRDECTVGLPKLAERCGFHVNQARKAKRALIARGLIEDLGDDVKNRDQELRGTRYRILLQRAPTRQVGATGAGANKDKDSKETLSKSNEPSAFQDCPDCSGSGFYYPKGYEGGVARCRHSKLK